MSDVSVTPRYRSAGRTINSFAQLRDVCLILRSVRYQGRDSSSARGLELFRSQWLAATIGNSAVIRQTTVSGHPKAEQGADRVIHTS